MARFNWPRVSRRAHERAFKIAREALPTNHQETTNMDRSITRKRNPVDRLDLACNDLAAYYCESRNDVSLLHVATMREALRSEAENDPDFAAALERISQRLEDRYGSLEEKATRP